MKKNFAILFLIFCSLQVLSQDSLTLKNKEMIGQLKDRITKIENTSTSKDLSTENERLMEQLKIKSDSISMLLKALKSPYSNHSGYEAVKNGKALTFLFNQKETEIDYSLSGELNEFMKKYDGSQTLIITGHADPSGLEYHNIRFSKERAKNLEAYVIKNYKVDPKKIITQWKGSSQPIPGSSELSKYHINRRVEIMVQ